MTANPIPLVLLIESDPVQRDLIQLSLKRIGCEVIATRDPDLAVNIISKQHPSLIIIDTFIPGSSGLEILTDLRQKKLLKHSGVFFISSFGFPEVIQQAKDSGAHEFLIKPLDMEDLLSRAKKLLQI